ncbi:MAG: tyrosine-type recombinase/integrase [Armatimonadia bacterium]
MSHLLRCEITPSASLSPALDDFLADAQLRGLSPKTVEWYRYALGPFLQWLNERDCHSADDLKEATIRQFLASRDGVGARRLNHYREAIDRFCQWLVRTGDLTANPTAGIGKIREPRKLVPTFTEEELQALLSKPDRRTLLGQRDHLFMLLLLDTGVRLSEALSLTLDDLDLTRGTLRVMGKGNRERVAGFSPVLERHLRKYLQSRRQVLGQNGYGNCQWLFPSNVAGKCTAKALQMRLKLYAQQAQIRRVRVSPHTFRHTFALYFVRNGGSPFHLQKILGHTSLDMSRRYCELADVDFLTKQRELSPLAAGSVNLTDGGRLR